MPPGHQETDIPALLAEFHMRAADLLRPGRPIDDAFFSSASRALELATEVSEAFASGKADVEVEVLGAMTTRSSEIHALVRRVGTALKDSNENTTLQ